MWWGEGAMGCHGPHVLHSIHVIILIDKHCRDILSSSLPYGDTGTQTFHKPFSASNAICCKNGFYGLSWYSCRFGTNLLGVR